MCVQSIFVQETDFKFAQNALSKPLVSSTNCNRTQDLFKKGKNYDLLLFGINIKLFDIKRKLLVSGSVAYRCEIREFDIPPFYSHVFEPPEFEPWETTLSWISGIDSALFSRIRHLPSYPPFSFPESAMFLPRIRHFLPSFCHPSLAKFEVKRTISAVLVCRFLPFGPFGSFLSASFQFISTGQVKIHTIEKRKSTKVPCNKNEIIKMKLFVALVGLRACLFILFFILYPLIIEFLQLVQIKRIIN